MTLTQTLIGILLYLLWKAGPTKQLLLACTHSIPSRGSSTPQGAIDSNDTALEQLKNASQDPSSSSELTGTGQGVGVSAVSGYMETGLQVDVLATLLPATQAGSAQPTTELHLSLGQPSPEHQTCTTYFFSRIKSSKLAEESFDAQLDHGLLQSGLSVQSLQQVLQNAASSYHATPEAAEGVAMHSMKYRHGGMLVAAQLLAAQLERTLQQMQRGSLIQKPDVALDDRSTKVDDAELQQLEDAQARWVSLISKTLDQENKRGRQGSGAPAEVLFWRQRTMALNGLHEQICSPTVQHVAALLEGNSGDVGQLAAFKTLSKELKTLTEEARDNLDLLTTLERHLKVLSEGDVPEVLRVLEPMLHALRTVWNLSRYFGNDQRMGALLEQIGQQVGDMVEAAFDLQALFHVTEQQAKQSMQSLKAVLERWFAVYMEVREAIEMSQQEARWEFSRQRLFERTSYMAEVLGELDKMLEALAGFESFLGPELKAIAGDSEEMARISQQVDALRASVRAVGYDVLAKQCSSKWRIECSNFTSQSHQISSATHDLILSSFRDLRSAEAALDALDSFRALSTGGGIAEQVAAMLQATLRQFMLEVGAAAATFDREHASAHVSRHHQPVAGAVSWGRSLFGKVKGTMLRLQRDHLEDLKSELGVQAQAQYMAFAKAVLQQEKLRYEQWCKDVDITLRQLLKQPILVQDPITTHVVTNLPEQLLNIIQEAHALDGLGFALPQQAMSAALQQDRLCKAQEDLGAMLQRYDQVAGEVGAVERVLLKEHLARLEQALAPGFTTLNWSSLTTPQFVATCNKAIGIFQSTWQAVHNSFALVEKAVHAIGTARFIPNIPKSAPGQGIALHDLAALVERHQAEVVQDMVLQYRIIGPQLCRVEEAVIGSSTGKSSHMRGCYLHWEAAVFTALNASIEGAMQTLTILFAGEQGLATLSSCGHLSTLQVALDLKHPDVIAQPSAHEVRRTLGQLVLGSLEAGRHFVRWMDGTCWECPEVAPMDGAEEDTPFLHSFLPNLAQSPAVVKAVQALRDAVQEACLGIGRQINVWQRYKPLWKTDREAWLKSFRGRNPTYSDWASVLAKYAKLAAEVETQSHDTAVGFVRLSSAAVAAAVRDEALAWVQAAADAMAAADRQALKELDSKIALLQMPVSMPVAAAAPPLQPVTAAVDIVLDLEVKCNELEDRCRMRLQYGIRDEEQGLAADVNDSHVRLGQLLARLHATSASRGPCQEEVLSV